MNRAVFLDRDGTIIYDVDYLDSVDRMRLLPNAIEGLRLLSDMDFKLIIITNQSGIGRGYYTEENLKGIHDKLLSELEDAGISIDRVYHCPHTPEDRCECRKPETGMIEQAKEDFGLDLSKCYLIGDKTTDIDAGKNAGCITIGVKTGYGEESKADHTVKDLYEAAMLIKRLG